MSIQINALQLHAPRLAELNPTAMYGAVHRLRPSSRIEPEAGPAALVSLSSSWASLANITHTMLAPPAAATASGQVSLLQTASSAIESVKSDLRQIRDLAAAAGKPKASQEEREALHSKAARLVEDIDRIATQTQFSGIRIFEQNPANRTGDPSLSGILQGLKGGWLENAEKMIQDYYGLKGDGAPLSIELASFSDGPYGVAARVNAMVANPYSGKGTNLKLQLDRADFLPAALPNGGSAPLYSDRIIAHELSHAVLARTTNYANLVRNATWFVEGIAEFIHGGDERFAWDLAQAGGNIQSVVDALSDGKLTSSIDYSASYAAVRYLHDQIKSAGGEGIKDVLRYLSVNPSASLNDAFRSAVAPLGEPVGAYTSASAFLNDFRVSGAAFVSENLKLDNTDTGAVGGADADGGAVRTAASVVPEGGTRVGNNVLSGFNERFETNPTSRSSSAATGTLDAYTATVRRAPAGAMNASALGVSALNLIEDPADAVAQADRALRYVSSEQTRIASQINNYDSMLSRLQNIFASLGNMSWLPVNGFASSVMNKEIRTHPADAVLAQDNINQQLVIQLLRVE